jgi:hypothetical protein
MLSNDDDYFNLDAARREVEEARARCEELKKQQAEERARERAEHDELCRARGPDFTMRTALLTAYLLGRSGLLVSNKMLDDWMRGLEDYDVMRLQRDSMKRDLAALRHEVEAARPHNVIAMVKRDGK